MTEPAKPETQGQTEPKPPENPTKAYSELYNLHKSESEKWKADKAALQKQIDDLRKSGDSSKGAEQLQAELEKLRGENTNLSNLKTSLDAMVKSAEEGLTVEQKAQLQYASEDPVKRFAFIQSLKGTPVPKKDSQGTPVNPDTDPAKAVDVEFIIKEYNRGNLQPYKDAKKKLGDKVVQKLVGDRTKAQPVPARG